MGTALLCDGEVTFSYDLAEHPADEGRMWDVFLARMDTMSCPVYHYGQYERSAIKKMMERYGSDDRALRLLDRLVDLERVLKECAALPLRGYSLKDVAPWLGFKWTGRTQGAEDSMLEYLHWLADGDSTHLHNILKYNEDDCSATRIIYQWLLTLL
jgi:predicted RecB family nuclease